MTSEAYSTPSLNGFIWHLSEFHEPDVSALVARYRLPDLTARVLAQRGITLETANAFLNPTLKEHLPNPFLLKDMKKATDRMALAIMKNEPVGLMGDYDVDGATSTAVLKLYLEKCGIHVLTFIPEREDGYGPSAKKMQEYKDAGCSVVATLDCGTTSFDAVQAGTDIGLDVIILDHHNAESTLPKAYAVVNPKRLDEPIDHPCHYMAAVGVVFLFVVALNKVLREKGMWQNKSEPNLIQFLDLVAFGTVCDVVKLTGVNRLFVKSGLAQMAKGQNIGLTALMYLLNLDEKPDTYHLGYVFGPRVNACGRVGKSDVGMQLLSCHDPVQASILAHRLEDFNTLRKDIEAAVLLQAMEQVESESNPLPFIFVVGKNWHCGVIGIVAGRLKERYNLPVFVLSNDGNDITGSSRSIDGVDVGALIMSALSEGILSRGGGHPMAAGFSLRPEKVDAFKDFLKQNILPDQVQHNQQTLNIAAVLNLSGVTFDFVKSLNLLAPFGEGNEEPLFVIQNVRITACNLLKNGHIGCTLSNMAGLQMRAIAFRAADTEMGRQMLSCHGEQFFDMVVILQSEIWHGTDRIKIQIIDMRPSG